jgi:hypothetical protein
MRHFSPIALTVLFLVTITSSITAKENTVHEGGTHVTYDGASDAYAVAIAKTVESARVIAKDDLGYAMPANIRVQVNVDPASETRLFNDGADFLSLTVRSERDLKKPAVTGIFHIYGLCHKVAHLAMYLPIKDRRWMTTAAAEGWAHYLGSRIVDKVYEQQGPDLWPDKYNYLEDGTRRLERQLAREDRTASTSHGAGLWQELGGILGDQEIADLFGAWGQSQVDPTAPEVVLEKELAQVAKGGLCVAWWKSAAPVFVSKQSASEFAALTAKTDALPGKAIELVNDDGNPAGKQSMAGGAHGVLFEAASDDFYLTSVRVHGARYGAKEAPKEDFIVTICDENFAVISTFKRPYSKFAFAQMKWTKVDVIPTLVPRKFAVFVDFNPTQRKGVFVSYDAGVDSKSYSGLPGKQPPPATKGDWLIRAEVDQLKSSDALREPGQPSSKEQSNEKKAPPK